MRNRFHPLRVSDVRQESADCVSLAFDIPEEVQEQFSYKPGQYLTLKSIIDGEDVRRSYSLCSGIDEPIRVAVKRMPHGLFSNYVNDHVSVGDEIEVMPPMGNFTLQTEHKGVHHVGFAAGSGITPIASMIQHLLNLDQQASFTLFYANRDSNSIIFKSLLENLKDRFLHRLSVYHLFTRERLETPLFNGRITEEKTQQLLHHFVDTAATNEYYICGPSEMIDSVEAGLLAEGIGTQQIHAERFTSPLDHKKVDASKEVVDHHQGDSQVTLVIDGEQMQFPLNYDGNNVLDQALKNGADLPFACKGGVCCTCKAKLLEGKVQMVVNYGLEPDEIEAGYILTCQSHPTTENIIVSFDE